MARRVTPNLWDPPVDAWSGKERRHPMLVHSERSLGSWFREARFFFSVVGAVLSAGVGGILRSLRRRTVLFLRDLELFASLCLARFIVWRKSRKRG